ncbi:MAG: hypothetical protein HY527_03730 [Betaproteobacteria bacterium]|nr:hypothetical protein [Betaproteobacteria bacterium]
MTICSAPFTELGRTQASALGHADLPIAVIPHPFGLRSREEVRRIAEQCVADIARLVCESAAGEAARAAAPASARSGRIEAPVDLDEFNRFCRACGWSDGLPLVPPTVERVEATLRHTRRARDEVIAAVAPGFGAASVEHIAANAVMAGCEPEYLPILIAAVEALADPAFNLQGIQATTNPATPWLIVNGPIARDLGINGGLNCLGQGAWANATIGRALRLILQNVGGARPGEMDRATHGQPGKYTFCCAENEAENPWEPLHVERGFARDSSTVTVVGASGTLNMNSHAKEATDLLRAIADTMAFPLSNDYYFGGEPWVILSPEHAEILKREGLGKSDVKRRLWEQSRFAAGRFAAKDRARVQHIRRAELGTIDANTLVPASPGADGIGIVVAGGPGTHSVYVPTFGVTRAVTRAVTIES